jgi:hypothetical protein
MDTSMFYEMAAFTILAAGVKTPFWHSGGVTNAEMDNRVVQDIILGLKLAFGARSQRLKARVTALAHGRKLPNHSP